MDSSAIAPATWPLAQLDVKRLRSSGWKPYPFNEFIVKIHSRCNLACDYCYVYEMADQSWTSQPKVMSRETMVATCRRIAEHIDQFGLSEVSLVLHGGEPLLARHREVEFFLSEAVRPIRNSTRLRLGIQTNGILLDGEFLEIFDRWGVKVGVSLDGNQEANDRHRRYSGGASSHAAVTSKISMLVNESQHLFSGLLCTIDVANDPVATYEELISFSPPSIDFLLPHGNWSSPPPYRNPDQSATPYADWLCGIFDRWYGAPVRETSVRFFDQIIDLLLGGKGGSEALGLSPVRLAVIETDGSLEQVDSLKSAFEGATSLGIEDADHPLAEALWHPAIIARQIGEDALSSTCLACPIRRVCGGGHFTHRYRKETGFLNPSVYCADLKKIISHIFNQLDEDLTRLGKKA